MLTDQEIASAECAHLSAHAQFVGAGEVWIEGASDFARAIEAAATAPLLARIAELDRSLDVMAQNTEAQAHASLQREIELAEKVEKLTLQLEEARKDAERWNWLNWHIGVAWGEEGFTSLIRIVSEKHRALINTQVDKLMAGELPEAPAIRAAIK